MIRMMLLFVLLAPAVARAQPPDEFFDSRTIHDIRLYVNSRDLAELRARYLEDVYVPADFEWRGIRVRNVGVRVRGLGTRSAIKPGLRIDFNRYTAEQAFLGMSALVLDNALKDPSLLRERISMAFIKRMGQPAPRESFGRVYINGSYEGLYTLVEEVDSAFLARELGDGLGYLFEHKFIDGFYGEFLGEDYAPYKLRFAAKTHELEGDYTLYAPIRELFREVNQDVDSVWRERVSWFVDLPQVVTHVAIETFLAEFDGFLGDFGMANFYLYRPVQTNVHRLDRLGQGHDVSRSRIAAVRSRRGERAHEPGAQVRRPSDALSGCARKLCALGRAGSMARKRNRRRASSHSRRRVRGHGQAVVE